MKLPVIMIVLMYVAILGSAALFNAVDATPELRVAVWGLIIMVCGGTAGAHGDKLPGSSSWRERHRQDTPPNP
jgi:hypothetical protein